MDNNFFLEETWAGYKSLDINGKRVAFVYGWDDVDQEYLEKVVEKYPEYFDLDKTSKDVGLLKIKKIDSLKMEILQSVVDEDNTGWFELIDLDTRKLLNSDKVGNESVAAESLNLL